LLCAALRLQCLLPPNAKCPVSSNSRTKIPNILSATPIS
jgi:hypothetical protein